MKKEQGAKKLKGAGSKGENCERSKEHGFHNFNRGSFLVFCLLIPSILHDLLFLYPYCHPVSHGRLIEPKQYAVVKNKFPSQNWTRGVWTTQQPKTRFLQDLFMHHTLIQIWWKTGCLQHLIRSIAREHNDNVDHGAREIKCHF